MSPMRIRGSEEEYLNECASASGKTSIQAVCHGSVSRASDLQNTADTAVAHRPPTSPLPNGRATTQTLPVACRLADLSKAIWVRPLVMVGMQYDEVFTSPQSQMSSHIPDSDP